MKGWSVFLVSALFALLAANGRTAFALLACIPTIVFWVLDGFFLWQEQLYRKLYDHVRVLKDDAVDFSMDIRPFKSGVAPTWMGAILSRTLIPFHGVLILVIVIVILIIMFAPG